VNVFQFLTSNQELYPWTPLGALPPYPVIARDSPSAPAESLDPSPGMSLHQRPFKMLKLHTVYADFHGRDAVHGESRKSW